MEEKFIDDWARLSRVELDRLFRSYRRVVSAYSSARRDVMSGFKPFGDGIICSEMFKMRELILMLEDPSERALLYYFYIDGYTLERCAEKLFISLRSATRIKRRGIESIMYKIKTEVQDN